MVTTMKIESIELYIYEYYIRDGHNHETDHLSGIYTKSPIEITKKKRDYFRGNNTTPQYSINMLHLIKQNEK